MSVRLVAIAAIVGIIFAAAKISQSAESAVPVQKGTASITPQNTKLQFVCAHVGPRPDPRKGGFAKFMGKAEVDVATKTLKSLDVDIDTTSLFTEVGDMLTNHLKSPDFFEVRRYPTAHFESTKIAANSSGTTQITGKLTLHGITREITFPATVEIDGSGMKLKSEFTLDRLEYGINYDPNKVETKVALSVFVGEKP
jgi:polyisoprenoid-binding protein YceI